MEEQFEKKKQGFEFASRGSSFIINPYFEGKGLRIGFQFETMEEYRSISLPPCLSLRTRRSLQEMLRPQDKHRSTSATRQHRGPIEQRGEEKTFMAICDIRASDKFSYAHLASAFLRDQKRCYLFRSSASILTREAEEDWASQSVLKALPQIATERISDKRSLIKQFLALRDPIGIGKKHLLITRFYGRRLKPCPGTSHHICCGYHVINAITNCPMDCSYCVLQGYLTNPLLTLYSNWDDLLQEMEIFLSSHSDPFLRLGTGELSDSLALDSIFPLSQVLIPFFAGRNQGDP